MTKKAKRNQKMPENAKKRQREGHRTANPVRRTGSGGGNGPTTRAATRRGLVRWWESGSNRAQKRGLIGHKIRQTNYAILGFFLFF